MDGFSYNNIFDTKGTEYLIIIGFLLMIIPFWILINRQVSIKASIRSAVGILSESILKIPHGLLFSKNHTWAHLEKSGVAEVGIDDFILHVTGDVKITNMKEPGRHISKGERMADIVHNGKLLQVFSPISGRVTEINSILENRPSMIGQDPYEKGWICKIDPTNWKEETDDCFRAVEARNWFRGELQRLKDFLAGSVYKYSPEMSPMMLQDGGELCDRPLSDLPGEIWSDFQTAFLDTSA